MEHRLRLRRFYLEQGSISEPLEVLLGEAYKHDIIPVYLGRISEN